MSFGLSTRGTISLIFGKSGANLARYSSEDPNAAVSERTNPITYSIAELNSTGHSPSKCDNTPLMQFCFDVRIAVFTHEQGFPLDIEIDELSLNVSHITEFTHMISSHANSLMIAQRAVQWRLFCYASHARDGHFAGICLRPPFH